MANSEQRARQRAQRALARQVRENRGKRSGERTRIIPKNYTSQARKANLAYADRVLSGKEPRPAKGSMEARMLARLAAQARWGKLSNRYAEFDEFWYHGSAARNWEDI